jgi:hypothetical protein
MATRYFCDKCGCQVPQASDLGQVSYPSALLESTTTARPFKELCHRCARRLADWLQPDPLPAEEAR